MSSPPGRSTPTFWARTISTRRSRRAPAFASSCAGSISRGTESRRPPRSDRKAGPPRRQPDAAARRLQHVIARHLHDVGAPIELLGFVLEEIGGREGVAIGLDVAVAGLIADRCIAPAEFPAGMLGADPPAIELHRQGAGVERIERRDAVDDDQPMHIEL